jgi:hypothetical protein
MYKTHAHVATDAASTYLFKLCKHFAKKIPATWTEDHRSGSASFEWGTTIFQATTVGLHIECMASDRVALERLANVVAQHLDLLTRKNPAPIQWSQATETVHDE